MWHRLPHEQKRAPGALHYERGGDAAACVTVTIPAGRATLGADRDGDSVRLGQRVRRAARRRRAFEIDVYNVTNADFLEFVDAGGYDARALWSDDGLALARAGGVDASGVLGARRRPMAVARHVRDIPLPAGWPVYVSVAEAAAFARWRGRRLPTEAEYHRAAFGTPDGRERALPWGEQRSPDAARGNFDFASWDRFRSARVRRCERVGRARFRRQRLGVDVDRSSRPFPGFEPMASYPEYSADFFDGQHYVMKGASPATARELVRRSFRNWFRPNYPYVYATFRTREVSSEQRVGASPNTLSTLIASHVRRRRRRDLALAPKQLQSKYLYDALGSSLFEAICRLPWYRITRAETRAARAARRRRSSRRWARPKARSSSSGAAAARRLCSSPRRSSAAAASARVHLIDISSQALEQTRAAAEPPAARFGRGPLVDLRGRATHGGCRAPRWQHDARPAPRIEHRQFRSRRPRRSSSTAFARRSRRAICCCSAPTWSSRSATCCSPMTTRSALPRPSTRTCSCA